MPVADAMPSSTSHSPVQRNTTSSLRPTNRRVRAKRLGAYSASHRSFAIGSIGCIGAPVDS